MNFSPGQAHDASIAQVEITIADVNEPPSFLVPIATEKLTFSIDEGTYGGNGSTGHVIGTLPVQDLDAGKNGEIRSFDIELQNIQDSPQTQYLTVITDNQLHLRRKRSYNDVGFEVVASVPDNKLRVYGNIDYEAGFSSYQFNVRVYDNGKPSLSAETSFQLNVIDINDHAPVFRDLPVAAVAVSEHSSAGFDVVSFTVFDVDSEINGRFVLSLGGGFDDAYAELVNEYFYLHVVYDKADVAGEFRGMGRLCKRVYGADISVWSLCVVDFRKILSFPPSSNNQIAIHS